MSAHNGILSKILATLMLLVLRKEIEEIKSMKTTVARKQLAYSMDEGAVVEQFEREHRRDYSQDDL